MRFLTGILALAAALFIFGFGASCLDTSFSAYKNGAGIGTSETLDGDESVQSIATASFGQSGVRMAGYTSGSGTLNEHHYVGTYTGESAEVHASASNTGHYVYSWDYLPGSHRIEAWEDVQITSGKNIQLSSAASNPEGDYAKVSTRIDKGSVDYFSSGWAGRSLAIASQVVNYADGNSIVMGWSAHNSEDDSVKGDVSFESGYIQAPTYAWAGADRKATRSELDLNDAQVDGYDISIEAENWLFRHSTEKSSEASRSLDLDILNAATAYKLQAKASVKRAT